MHFVENNMISEPLYFLDGVQFANGYERVVHGGRGPYVELKKDNILHELISVFSNKVPDEINIHEPYYYYFLKPYKRQEKIYWQIKTVKYADYKIGMYYISPSLLLPFREIDPRIKSLF